MSQGLKTILNFGAYIGLSDFIVFIILFLGGYNPLGPASWYGVFIPIILMVAGTRSYRIYYTEGYMTYWKAFSTLMSIAIAGAVLFGVMVYMFGMLVDQSLVEMKINEAIEGFEKLRKMMGDEWYEKNMAKFDETRGQITLASIAVNDVITKMLGALFVSLIAAFFLRKPKPFFDQTI